MIKTGDRVGPCTTPPDEPCSTGENPSPKDCPMATSFGALCTDFYVNQKLAVKMDLPSEREASLHFFERIRQQLPAMSKFKRYDGELALESQRRRDDPRYQWLALRRNSIRAGHVNPDSMQQAMDYHKFILQQVPYHLSISPLDVDCVELTFGFDLECETNHDEVVYNALFADTPLGKVMDVEGGKVLDCQPFVSVNLNDTGSLQAYFEVKTRQKSRRGSSGPVPRRADLTVPHRPQVRPGRLDRPPADLPARARKTLRRTGDRQARAGDAEPDFAVYYF